MDLLQNYFPDLTIDQVASFKKLGPLYQEWNEKINVISRKDIDGLYEKHVLHSLAIARVIHFKPASRILDVGTGGGFPGIPLAILFPEVQFTLIDSIGKKIKVVQAVAEALNLKNVVARHSRVQEIKQPFDFIVSRAVTAFPDFVKMVQKNVDRKQINALPNGILYLKGGDLDEELFDYRNSVELFSISEFFSEPFFETKKVVYLPIFN